MDPSFLLCDSPTEYISIVDFEYVAATTAQAPNPTPGVMTPEVTDEQDGDVDLERGIVSVLLMIQPMKACTVKNV
jgi:hypothetical protein